DHLAGRFAAVEGMPQHERRCRLARSRDCDGRPQSGVLQPLGRFQRGHQSLSGKTKAGLYPALAIEAKNKGPARDQSGRRDMSGNAAAVLTKPAFRKIEWLERDIAVERRADCVIIFKSWLPLRHYENHIPTA